MKLIDVLGVAGFLVCLALAFYFNSVTAVFLSLVAAAFLLLLGFLFMTRRGGKDPEKSKEKLTMPAAERPRGPSIQ